MERDRLALKPLPSQAVSSVPPNPAAFLIGTVLCLICKARLFLFSHPFLFLPSRVPLLSDSECPRFSL